MLAYEFESVDRSIISYTSHSTQHLFSAMYFHHQYNIDKLQHFPPVYAFNPKHHAIGVSSDRDGCILEDVAFSLVPLSGRFGLYPTGTVKNSSSLFPR